MSEEKKKTITYMTIFVIGIITIYIIALYFGLFINDKYLENTGNVIYAIICGTYMQLPLAVRLSYFIIKKLSFTAKVYVGKGNINFSGVFMALLQA